MRGEQNWPQVWNGTVRFCIWNSKAEQKDVSVDFAVSANQERVLTLLPSDQDEFSIPEGSEKKPWFQALDFRLRLNRAGYGSVSSRDSFVESLNSVSDHLGCLFYILRHLPNHVSDTAHENRAVNSLLAV